MPVLLSVCINTAFHPRRQKKSFILYLSLVKVSQKYLK